jgi:hypothetical protein
VQSTVRISCSEIYQEHVFDLLGDQRSRQPLLVREHTSTGFYLEGELHRLQLGYTCTTPRARIAIGSLQVRQDCAEDARTRIAASADRGA